ncbi:hypothetical protein JCM11641_003950 [Rhodosporidiobolus odoratus]
MSKSSRFSLSFSPFFPSKRRKPVTHVFDDRTANPSELEFIPTYKAPSEVERPRLTDEEKKFVLHPLEGWWKRGVIGQPNDEGSFPARVVWVRHPTKYKGRDEHGELETEPQAGADEEFLKAFSSFLTGQLIFLLCSTLAQWLIHFSNFTRFVPIRLAFDLFDTLTVDAAAHINAIRQAFIQILRIALDHSRGDWELGMSDKIRNRGRSYLSEAQPPKLDKLRRSFVYRVDIETMLKNERAIISTFPHSFHIFTYILADYLKAKSVFQNNGRRLRGWAFDKNRFSNKMSGDVFRRSTGTLDEWIEEKDRKPVNMREEDWRYPQETKPSEETKRPESLAGQVEQVEKAQKQRAAAKLLADNAYRALTENETRFICWPLGYTWERRVRDLPAGPGTPTRFVVALVATSGIGNFHRVLEAMHLTGKELGRHLEPAHVDLALPFVVFDNFTSFVPIEAALGTFDQVTFAKNPSHVHTPELYQAFIALLRIAIQYSQDGMNRALGMTRTNVSMAKRYLDKAQQEVPAQEELIGTFHGSYRVFVWVLLDYFRNKKGFRNRGQAPRVQEEMHRRRTLREWIFPPPGGQFRLHGGYGEGRR